MKNKKVYIGIAAILLIVIISVVSIFYISSKNKDVKELSQNVANEDAKKAMESTEEVKSELKDANEEKEEEKIEEPQEEVKEEKQEEVKQEEVKKEEVKKVEVKKEEPKKEIVVTPLEKTMFVTATSLNVRTEPNTECARLGSLANAAEVSITGQTDDWYRISYNNKVAYVKSCYLSDTKPEVVKTPVSTVNPSNEVQSTNTLIIINSRNNTLRFYVDGNLSQSYSCATGTSSTPTPQGICKVVKKIVNRPYYKSGIPGGDPRNPLGKRWMGLSLAGTGGDTYGIHGTNNESSIGTHASHGCIRMHNADVEYFYDFVPVGTTVIIKNTSQSDQEIAAGYGISIN